MARKKFKFALVILYSVNLIFLLIICFLELLVFHNGLFQSLLQLQIVLLLMDELAWLFSLISHHYSLRLLFRFYLVDKLHIPHIIFVVHLKVSWLVRFIRLDRIILSYFLIYEIRHIPLLVQSLIFIIDLRLLVLFEDIAIIDHILRVITAASNIETVIIIGILVLKVGLGLCFGVVVIDDFFLDSVSFSDAIDDLLVFVLELLDTLFKLVELFGEVYLLLASTNVDDLFDFLSSFQVLVHRDECLNICYIWD